MTPGLYGAMMGRRHWGRRSPTYSGPACFLAAIVCLVTTSATYGLAFFLMPVAIALIRRQPVGPVLFWIAGLGWAGIGWFFAMRAALRDEWVMIRD